MRGEIPSGSVAVPIAGDSRGVVGNGASRSVPASPRVPASNLPDQIAIMPRNLLILRRTRRCLSSLGTCVAASLICLAARAVGAEPEAAPAPRFETHVAPILKKHCADCHNSQTRKAELDLSSPRALFRGGESGAIVEAGKPEESLLYEMVHEQFMPPEGEPLSETEVAAIRDWIAGGALLERPLEAGGASEERVTNHDIEPLMLLRCGTCHGLRDQQGGLDLRTKASMLRGGQSGPALVPGSPEKSLLLKRIHAGEMPPPEKLVRAGVRPMTPSEIERLEQWIRQGAPEVDAAPDVAGLQGDPLVTDEDRQFWSFQPPRKTAPPAIDAEHPPDNPIDAFVIARQQALGLSLSPEADRLTLLRRAHYDLTGLPPAPDEVREYLADDDPRAYEKRIDRLLAAPQYGERWGRFWLDGAGYADSEGKRSADPLRPHAWRYRDYVIRSFNADKPYDRFLLEQIAGDELADYDNAPRITRQLADNLIATGFLRMAPDGTGSDIVNTVAERMEVIADEIDVLGATVMGLTLKCARCHSHKYDPLPQRDYYRLLAVFKGAYDEHDWLKPSFVPGQTKDVKPGRVLPLVADEEREAFERRGRELDARIAEVREQLERLGEEIRAEHTERELAKLPSPLHDDLRRMLATDAERRDAVLTYLADKFEDQLTLTDKQLQQNERYRQAADKSDKQVKALEAQREPEPAIRALWDRGEPSPTYIYRRGDFQQPGRLVGPGVPSVLTDGRTPFEVEPPWPGAAQTGRRLAFARWLVEPNHPLTARVMVNRIWRHHFGEGIVKSIDNFGKLGDRPTHPELLDWLALEFIRSGWSVKHMHRLIMTSRVYRQSSAVGEELESADPENKWLTRMPLRRLDAEQIRDALLSVAGRLHNEPFGRPDEVEVRKDGLVVARADRGGWRRSIYLRQRRKEMPTFLETFDFPQMIPACQQRPESTVAQQALYLMNNAVVRELSASFADRVAAASQDDHERVELVYLTALSRPPTEEERTVSLETLTALAEQWQRQLGDSAAPGEPRRRALAVLCHTIMNSAAFLYVD